VNVRVKAHPYFKRRDNDVLVELKVNVAQATLGARVKVPTLEGEQEVVIPAGTQPNTVLRIRDLGIPHLRGSGRGDQLVVVQVAIPTQLTDDQQALFESLADNLGTEVIVEEKYSFVDRIREALGI
jgi:molecular chaperone DnaJ